MSHMTPRLILDLEPRTDGRYACALQTERLTICGSVATLTDAAKWARETQAEAQQIAGGKW